MEKIRHRLPPDIYNNVYDFVTISERQVRENKAKVILQLQRRNASIRLKKLFLRLRQRYALTRLAMYFSTLAEEVDELGRWFRFP